MKATEQYFSVVLFIMLYKVVLTFVSVDEILWCDQMQMKATEQYFWMVPFVYRHFTKWNYKFLINIDSGHV